MNNLNVQEELNKGFQTAFVDWKDSSNPAYRPEFVSNDAKAGRCVLSAIEGELKRCDSFSISVAFITEGGLEPLLQILKELEQRKIPGRVLTTDYLGFNEPKALDKLQSLRNIDLRMYKTLEENEGFHTKGYIFREDGVFRIIVGSSNLTASALKLNKEWNVKLVGQKSGELAQNILKEFDALWTSPKSMPYEVIRDEYKAYYDTIKQQKKVAMEQEPVELEQYRLRPNSMQVAFINRLQKMVSEKKEKALLISATGTGKTYASAFALRSVHPRKILFLVHREQIALQAMESYKRVFGKYKEDGTRYRYELLSGSTSGKIDKIRAADLIFATMQTMSKPEMMQRFSPYEFTEICIDEAHHSGAESYQRIMKYFHPRLWLGMTASPDTTRFNVYELFDYNIAYEIRLQQALEENLLCPFHYFGITDLAVDGEVIGDEDHQSGFRNFNRLISDQRVDYVIQQAEYYGYSGSRVKGIVFCSRRKEAEMLSKKFNQRGYRTAALTGSDDETVREQVLDRLAMDVAPEDRSPAPADYDPKKEDGYLDYVFAVDILSEGVDIPEINQVIMLRPTESVIVFVQQLGRGLRKSKDKEFVVILDFIGNYANNFLIPIALSGDQTYNKDNVRRYVMEGDRVIPGVSTVHFDEVSRKRILESVDRANFSDIKLLKDNYQQLKNKLGRIPSLMDFDNYGSIDVCRIFDNSNLGSYYKFLEKYEPDYPVRLSEEKAKTVEFISKKLASGKRVHELELIQILLEYHKKQMFSREEVLEQHAISDLGHRLKDEYGITMNSLEAQNIVNVMTNAFSAGTGKKTYSKCIFIENADGDYRISRAFEQMLEDSDFYDIVFELVQFGISRYQKNYSRRYRNTNMVLYQKYTYEDTCRLLDWETNVVSQNIGGYKYDEKTKTFPVFINYDKDDNISDTTKYEDHFINENTLIAISKSKRNLNSPDVQNFLRARERGIAVHLFIRKNKDDHISKEYYYLGEMTPSGYKREFRMPNTKASAVEIGWNLDTPVREDIYEYLIG